MIVSCYVNGGKAQSWKFLLPAKDNFLIRDAHERCSLTIDPKVVPASGELVITFFIPGAASPFALGINPDTRSIALGLAGMRIEAT
jgi:hypothetical protein